MALEAELCGGLQLRSAAGGGRGPTSKTSHLEFGAAADLLATEGLQGTRCFIYRAKWALVVSLELALELIKHPPHSGMLNATSASEGRKETTN